MSGAATADRGVILAIEGLEVAYRVRGQERSVLKDLDLRISRRQAYGLVGESGSGKSTAAFAAVRYLPRAGRVVHGRICIEGRDLMAMSAAELRAVRTHGVAMVYQDPGRALNPTLRIGRQMSEIYELSEQLPRAAATRRAAEMLARVRIGNPQRVLDSYPHEISGGMQQRVIIAMALSSSPALLVLDEPTTGLDATVEAEVLELIAGLRTELSTAILFISHSLPVIARMCDTVGVLYAGQLIEEGPAAEVLANPRHPYTVALLRCAPRFGQRKSAGRLSTIAGFQPAGALPPGCLFAQRCAIATDLCRTQVPPRADLGGRWSRCHYPQRASELANAAEPAAAAPRAPAYETPLLKVRGLSKTYPGSRARAVDGIDFELWPGETLGLVGESGSGKSSLGKLLLGLVAPDSGSLIELDGASLAGRVNRRTPQQIKALQIIFQNPGSALNASHSVRRLIGRALRMVGLRGAGREARLRALATAVRLSAAHLDEKPRALSGGLKQRVAIARAFAGEPQIVVCDEPTSALDLSVQASILNLLVQLQEEQRVSYIFISHDLAVVHYLADRIAVLYGGRLLEIGPAAQVFAGPHHPYTETLLAAAAPAAATPQEPEAPGDEPEPTETRSAGCVFQQRCPRKIGPLCETQAPPFADAGAGHRIRCHIAVEELRAFKRAP